MEWFFMLIGLGFFLTITTVILRDDRTTYERRRYAENLHYQRKLDEAREFGYHNSRLENDTKHQPKK